MAYKCIDIPALRNALQREYSVSPDENQMGKSIFRIQGVICTLFSNGSVQLQGQNNPSITHYVEMTIEKINNL
ncbi:hypothetical protein [Acinetobacter towneri]|mgnify:FL=1|jgi:hypothetical protein|uniref:Uncharacterized protein n=1 Tax=Acinetobacter towneri TaxID=202956 RepID=A0AB35M7R8_9GAMM|nr:hypothetical protein [Acinetobacter towneri]MDM1720132.1 hypothetical protein [Acinetobacter towneri]MDM1732208.1 hypothetical protein [Acinetobacter towneri]MDM1734930.1 hypothetical protein [Acinetobacter towneri]MDM1740203.1 hypothetical protein [Acinetobacter towneri]MDM1742854.1 hypothetical protein [Acinetobacter towneri]